MGRSCLVVACASLLAIGCDGESTFPSSPSSTSSPPPGPAPASSLNQQPTGGVLIVLEEAVTARVTQDDPLCGGPYLYRCRYFRLAASRNGHLTVTMRWDSQVADPYPLDIGVIDPFGRMAFPTIGPGTQRQVSLPVSAGSTYVIEIWSAAAPGEQFELYAAIDQ